MRLPPCWIHLQISQPAASQNSSHTLKEGIAIVFAALEKAVLSSDPKK
jgi:hypothetical protein